MRSQKARARARAHGGEPGWPIGYTATMVRILLISGLLIGCGDDRAAPGADGVGEGESEGELGPSQPGRPGEGDPEPTPDPQAGGEGEGEGESDDGGDAGGGGGVEDDPWQDHGGTGDGGGGGDGEGEAGGPDQPADPGTLAPWPGELTILQLHLTGVMLAESAIVVGPDGTTVLLDAGSVFHAADIRGALAEVNAAIREWPGDGHGNGNGNGPEDDGPADGDVDWLVLTHYHADHEGGVEPLLLGPDAITIRKGVVSRGPYDIGAAAGSIAYRSACDALGQRLSDDQRYELCVGDERAPCEILGGGSPWPASSCPGLLAGDLEGPAPAEPEPAYIGLGEGARMNFVGADGFFATPAGIQDSRAAGVEIGYVGSNEENARSIWGVISFGDFTYTFGGDLTGDGAGTPAVEGFLAALDPPPADLPATGADVMHAHHHGSDTSNSVAMVDRLMPLDGAARNAVIGTGPAYLSNPKREVVERLLSHTQGGAVWAPEKGAISGAGDFLIQTRAPVVVRTQDAGARYLVGPDPNPDAANPARGFDSIP